MTAYEIGFMAKCAELGVTDTESRLLFKHAAFTRDEALQRIQASRDAVAGEEGLNVGDRGLPGTWLGRTIRRPFMSPGSFASYYDAHTAGKVRQARDAAGGGADVQSYGNYGRVQPPPAVPAQPAGGGIANPTHIAPANDAFIRDLMAKLKASRTVPAAEELSGAALSNANDQEARAAAFSSGLASGNLDTSYLPSRHFTTR